MYNHFKTSWTEADAATKPKCSTDGVTQETANFDNCVDGTVVTNFGTEYDWNSIMHYDLKA